MTVDTSTPVMTDDERKERERRVRALILGAQDMDQTIFAAELLRDDDRTLDARLRRLIETSMVVCYMRPFTQSTLLRLTEFEPTEQVDTGLHAKVRSLRNKVSAHTDEDAPRNAFFSLGHEVAEEDEWVPYGERYTLHFDREELTALIDLCQRIRNEMVISARKTWIELGRPGGEL